MIIWRLANPFDYRFAEASLRGSWRSIDGSGHVCPKCTASRVKRVKPLIIEWEMGSDVIGDFIWPGVGSVVATERVVLAIRKDFKGLEPGPVEMVQNPRLETPIKKTSSSKPRVWLPYRGPALYELWTELLVPMNSRSTTRLTTDCEVCGQRQYEISGIERRETEWNPVLQDLVETQVARTPGEGALVDAEKLRDHQIFRVRELPSWLMCTDDVKKMIERQAFTNVSFLEMGEVS